MQILTWNCRRGPLAAKRAAVESLGSDVVVLTEASRPSAQDTDVMWFGQSRYGVAVYARPPYAVRSFARDDVPCAYPLEVTGPRSFTLFAVWTWAAPSYQLALLNGLQAYQSLPKPWVVMGDFNGNVKFDRPRSKKAKWWECFQLLENEGLVSAYHDFTQIAAGSDDEVPTHYFRTH